ncbi:MAG: class I SAM-dependent methyltransferase [Fibrobacterales bacterium]
MLKKTIHLCPLCGNSGKVIHQIKAKSYYQCENCFGMFVDPEYILSNENEKMRYEEHDNDVENIGYQNFVSPITNAITRDYTKNHSGLDFGAGTGPVISKILNDNSYQIAQYDPFFHNHPELLNGTYDYIACCEVIEHFHDPSKEFTLLKRLLNKKGTLYCMTHIYDEETTFKNWYYLNDTTHVFIYHKKTIEWVAETYGFSDVTIEGKLICFSIQ